MNFRRDQSASASDMLADDDTKDRTVISDRAVGSPGGTGEGVMRGLRA